MERFAEKTDEPGIAGKAGGKATAMFRMLFMMMFFGLSMLMSGAVGTYVGARYADATEWLGNARESVTGMIADGQASPAADFLGIGSETETDPEEKIRETAARIAAEQERNPSARERWAENARSRWSQDESDTRRPARKDAAAGSRSTANSERARNQERDRVSRREAAAQQKRDAEQAQRAERTETPAPAPAAVPAPAPTPEAKPLLAATPNVSPTAAIDLVPPPTAPMRDRAPEMVEVTLPAGTALMVELVDELSTKTARVEDRVDGVVTSDVVIDGVTAVTAGSRLTGVVTDVDEGGRLKGAAHLAVRFTRLTLTDGAVVELSTDSVEREGPSPGATTATRTSGAGAVGAVLGGIFGGKRGAAIGGSIGAAGGAASSAGRAKPAVLEAGTELSVTLSHATRVIVEKSDG